MRSLVVVPTYEEAPNVQQFLRAVRSAVPAAEILLVDDASPDGTGALAEEVAAELGQIHVLHRAGKDGLGSAYRAGFAWALDAGVDIVVQMDCDFSHDPSMIATLIDVVSDGPDCVVGSRYVPGGSTPNWPWHRRTLSRYGNRYTAAMLSLDVADATSGFRAYKAKTLDVIDVGSTKSNGYAFMSELALRMTQHGLRIEELPITFVDRAYGTSKMSTRIITESMVIVTFNGLRDRLTRWRHRGGR